MNGLIRCQGLIVGLLTVLSGCAPPQVPISPEGTQPVELPEVATQVVIRRTTYGVPQILAENLRAAAFGLAYVQLEDDNPVDFIQDLQARRGRAAPVRGRAVEAADLVAARIRYFRAVEMFSLLAEDTREIYHGFAEGVNHYIGVHRDALPDWIVPDFTAYDVLARDVRWPSENDFEGFRERIDENPGNPPVLVPDGDSWLSRGTAGGLAASPNPSALLHDETQVDQNVGSNAWALAPSRTTSGHAILLRNPHLAWVAGYYEAHVRVPGKLDFYGDFRLGGPFGTIGGFNSNLGWATTNSRPRTHETYAFRVHPDLSDHLLVDGAAVPLRREVVEVEVLEGTRVVTESREVWTSPFGPVIRRTDRLVYVLRPVHIGEFRRGEQWLRMMGATSLDEWREAMKMRAGTDQNYTYADRDGNILYVWVSASPALPHPPGGDSLAVLAERSDQVWSRLVPFDSLPQVLNPPGGYLHNENNSPHYANLGAILDHSFSFEVEAPRLGLRGQLALELLNNDRVFSLEDVVDAKHNMRMLLADRVKDDLLAAVARTSPVGDIARAADLLEDWDNTAAAESRGAILFETWWSRYLSLMDSEAPHETAWSEDEPTTTPRGLADLDRAVEAFEWALPETVRRFGSWDLSWGEAHRVRRGDVDVPVGGCGGALGCFRVLNFFTAEDGRQVVNGGDNWVLAVEFGDEPRAYSILGAGESPNPESPFHANQAAMFAAGEMKTVLWTESEIEAGTVYRYHPGESW